MKSKLNLIVFSCLLLTPITAFAAQTPDDFCTEWPCEISGVKTITESTTLDFGPRDVILTGTLKINKNVNLTIKADIFAIGPNGQISGSDVDTVTIDVFSSIILGRTSAGPAIQLTGDKGGNLNLFSFGDHADSGLAENTPPEIRSIKTSQIFLNGKSTGGNLSVRMNRVNGLHPNFIYNNYYHYGAYGNSFVNLAGEITTNGSQRGGNVNV